MTYTDECKVQPTIAQLHQQVLDAANALAEARAEERTARSRATDRLNRLNAAQREFDKKVAELKTVAPYDSDWAAARRPSKEIAVGE